MGFYTLYIYYRVRAVLCIPPVFPWGCVREARTLYYAYTVERESITEIRWPAINPTRKMLSLFLFSLLFIFFSPFDGRRRQRDDDDHTQYDHLCPVRWPPSHCRRPAARKSSRAENGSSSQYIYYNRWYTACVRVCICVYI